MVLDSLLRRCDAPEGFLEPRDCGPSEDRGTPGFWVSSTEHGPHTHLHSEASCLELEFAAGSSCVLQDPAVRLEIQPDLVLGHVRLMGET